MINLMKFASYKQIYCFNVQTNQMYSHCNLVCHCEFRSISPNSEGTAGVICSYILWAIPQKESFLFYIKGKIFNLKLSVHFMQNTTYTNEIIYIILVTYLQMFLQLLRTSRNKTTATVLFIKSDFYLIQFTYLISWQFLES